jgi:putative endopeptidase
MLKKMIYYSFYFFYLFCFIHTDISIPQIFFPNLQDNDIAKIVLSLMDQTVNPCMDFYNFSCGNWLKNTQIPPDQGAYYRTFNSITDNNLEILKEIVSDSTLNKKTYTYYSSCMNMTKRNIIGNEPIQSILKNISSIKNIEDFFFMVGFLHGIGVTNILFNLVATPDGKKPSMNIAELGQSGIALYDRSLYLNPDEKLISLYSSHITKMFNLAGFNPNESEIKAKQALTFETAIAEIMIPNDQLIDPFKLYNKIDLNGLKKIAPNIPWNNYLTILGFPYITQITVDSPEYISNLSILMNNKTLESCWISYLQWETIHTWSVYLNEEFATENFNFFGKVLLGLKEQAPLWKTCSKATDQVLGDITGTLFAKKKFPSTSKEMAETMIQYIEEAMKEDLQTISWMDSKTREAALKKVSLVSNLIGSPINPDKYEDVTLTLDHYFFNTLELQSRAIKKTLSQIQKPVDKNQWYMTADTVNAYYTPLLNQMVFPAGIMQSPFFDQTYPWPMNFGGIGMVMGHELTHGFDNQGKDYDGKGYLIDWWQEETVKKFNEKAACVINQYSNFEVLPGIFINGNLTQGENIADMGGVKNSYHAFRRKIGNDYLKPSIVPGFTQEQLFFISFAQGWCALAKEEYIKRQVIVDPHSPARFRVIGPLINTPQFASAFNCPVGSFMNPPKRCEVW